MCSPSGQDEGIRAEEPSLVSQGWTYLRDRATKSASSLVLAQLEEVEEDFPWLGEAQQPSAGTRLVVSPDQDAVEEIAKAIGNTKVERLILVSAFFDPKLAALKRMISKLSPKRVDIVVQEDSVSISGEQLKTIAGLNFYRLRQAGKRYAHAKVFIAECKGRSVMLAWVATT